MKHLEHFHELKSLTRKQKFFLLSLLPVYFMVIGLFLQPIQEIGPGIVRLIKEPDFLITDYFVVGGVGAALINAGALTLMSIGIIYFMGMDMDGHTITSSCLMFGFSLFGKNLLNIWAILAGVYLYARYHKTSMRRYIYIGFYGTSLSPIITQMLQVGYSLYNVGFAAGIIATVIVSVLKSLGVEIESRLIWSTGNNEIFGIVLSVLFGGMIVFGVAVRGRSIWESYRRIIKSYGIGGTDYLRDEGGASTVFNMGVNGLFATYFVLAVGGELNGPTICGIFTIVGFGATGKHLRNIAPVMMGVYLASFTKTWNIYQPSPMLALLFSTTLAPVAGEFGVVAGIVAGYLHSSVALNVGIVYGGMNLYNNGYAGGIVAIFMVPVIHSIMDRRARARGGLSL